MSKFPFRPQGIDSLVAVLAAALAVAVPASASAQVAPPQGLPVLPSAAAGTSEAGDAVLPNAEPALGRSELFEMAKRQAKIRSLQLQIQEAELERKLQEILAEPEDKPKDESEAAAPAPAPAPASWGAAQPAVPPYGMTPGAVSEPVPLVSSIRGAGGDVVATVIVPRAGSVTAREGDVLPNGMRVTSIGTNGVTVSDNGKSRVLGFADGSQGQGDWPQAGGFEADGMTAAGPGAF